MTADTNSPLLQLLLMGTGNDNNAWGDNHNTNVTLLIEQAIAGTTTITSTGGAYVLTANESRSAIIFVTGALTSDLTITVPTLSKKWTFINLTSGAFSTLVKTAAQTTPSQLPQSKATDIFVNNIVGRAFRIDRSQVGQFFMHAGVSAANTGGLGCDGSTLLIASYPDLYAEIGTTYGGNGVTTFVLPNGQDTGRYLRSSGGSLTVGTSQANQNKSHTHTGSGTTSGASVGHTHTGSGTTSGASVTHTHTGSGTTSGASADHTHTFAGTTATESATHTHTIGGLGVVAINNGAGASQGNLLTTVGGTPATLGPSSTESATHTHTYSGTTAGVSADHTHTYSFTTSVNSVDHTHTYSFTTSGVSVDHTHTYSFTTSTGSADGTEARPESLVALLCIRY